MEYMESKMQDHYEAGNAMYVELEKVTAERAALAAQVEALKISDSELHTLVEDLIDHLRYNKRESTDVLETYWDRLSAIQTTQISPQKHLAEIRAQAGREGFIAGSRYDFSCYSEYEIALPEVANQYADSIRQEKK